MNTLSRTFFIHFYPFWGVLMAFLLNQCAFCISCQPRQEMLNTSCKWHWWGNFLAPPKSRSDERASSASDHLRELKTWFSFLKSLRKNKIFIRFKGRVLCGYNLLIAGQGMQLQSHFRLFERRCIIFYPICSQIHGWMSISHFITQLREHPGTAIYKSSRGSSELVDLDSSD